MSIFDNLIPSESFYDFWLFASPKVQRKETQIPSKKKGKWLLFGEVKDIDNYWKIIKLATENGVLGTSSKVSTSRPNPNAKNQENQRVICIYTYNIEDIENIMEVRQELRKLGFNQKMCYKSDEATRNKLYGVNGDKGYSLFYE